MARTPCFKTIHKKLREAAHTDLNCGGPGANAEANMALHDLKRIELVGRELTKLVALLAPHHTQLIKNAQRVFGKE